MIGNDWFLNENDGFLNEIDWWLEMIDFLKKACFSTYVCNDSGRQIAVKPLRI